MSPDIHSPKQISDQEGNKLRGKLQMRLGSSKGIVIFIYVELIALDFPKNQPEI